MRRELAAQAARFIVVGVANTVLCIGIVWIAHIVLGVSIWWASAAGYAVGTAQSFRLNRLWTFAGHAREAGHVGAQLAAFIAVNAVTGVIFAAINDALAGRVALVVATFAALVVVTPLGFVLNRWLVFRSAHRTAGR